MKNMIAIFAIILVLLSNAQAQTAPTPLSPALVAAYAAMSTEERVVPTTLGQVKLLVKQEGGLGRWASQSEVTANMADLARRGCTSVYIEQIPELLNKNRVEAPFVVQFKDDTFLLQMGIRIYRGACNERVAAPSPRASAPAASVLARATPVTVEVIDNDPYQTPEQLEAELAEAAAAESAESAQAGG